MYGQKHDSHNQDEVDESRSNVKRKKSEQPKNDQNCSEYPKHVFDSFCRKVPADQKPIPHAQHGSPLLAGLVLLLIMVPDQKSKICSL
jgi:hypothetical protein